MSKFKTRTPAPEIEYERSTKCKANGCPMEGTIDPGSGRYVCAHHYAALPDQWPRVTEGLLQHQSIRLGIAQVLGTGDMDWVRGQWELMHRYFAADPELQPTVVERDHKRWYEYRLRAWLDYLCGASSKRPAPRQPFEPAENRTNAALFAALL